MSNSITKEPIKSVQNRHKIKSQIFNCHHISSQFNHNFALRQTINLSPFFNNTDQKSKSQTNQVCKDQKLGSYYRKGSNLLLQSISVKTYTNFQSFKTTPRLGKYPKQQGYKRKMESKQTLQRKQHSLAYLHNQLIQNNYQLNRNDPNQIHPFYKKTNQLIKKTPIKTFASCKKAQANNKQNNQSELNIKSNKLSMLKSEAFRQLFTQSIHQN